MELALIGLGFGIIWYVAGTQVAVDAGTVASTKLAELADSAEVDLKSKILKNDARLIRAIEKSGQALTEEERKALRKDFIVPKSTS